MILLFKSKVYLLLFVIIMGIFAILSIGISKDNSETKTIRIGFSSDMFSGINMRDAKSAIELYVLNMAEEIIKKHGVKFKGVSMIFNNKTELIEAIQNNKVDLVSSSTKEFLEIKDKFKLVPSLLNSQKNSLENYVLLINKDKNIKSLADLKDKKLLVISGGRGDLGLTWLSVELMKAGLSDCESTFSEIKRTEKQNQSIMPVFFGQYDACITYNTSFNEMANLNPQVSKKLFIIKQSDHINYTLMYFTSNVDNKTKEMVLDVALNLHTYPAGKQILKLFQNSRVVKFEDIDIQPVEKILNEYKILKSKDKKVK